MAIERENKNLLLPLLKQKVVTLFSDNTVSSECLNCIDFVRSVRMTQCIEKGRQEDNFVNSVKTNFVTHQTFLAWVIISSCNCLNLTYLNIDKGKTANVFWRKCPPVDALWVGRGENGKGALLSFLGFLFLTNLTLMNPSEYKENSKSKPDWPTLTFATTSACVICNIAHLKLDKPKLNVGTIYWQIPSYKL